MTLTKQGLRSRRGSRSHGTCAPEGRFFARHIEIQELQRLFLAAALLGFLMVASTLAAQLPPGTAAYYPFNGSAADFSGNSNHLQALTGAPRFLGSGGPFAGALYLDGSTTLGTVSGLFPAGVPTGGNPYTVACFVKADPGSSPNGGWIGYGMNGGQRWANNFRFNGFGGVWNYWWNLDLGAVAPNGGNFTTGWHSVVGTWDGATRKIYIDRLLQASDTPGAPAFGNTSFVVGKTLNDANLKGWVAELLIAKRAFSEAEVEAYNTYGGQGIGPTLTTLTSSLNPSTMGDSVTFTARVLETNGVAASFAGGSIVVNDGATPIGANAVSAGMASLATTGLAVGAHLISATYGGDTHYLPSVSTNLLQIVMAAPTNVVITGQPQSLVLPLGAAGAFSVTVRGAPPFSYQWYHAASPIPDGNSATLRVTNSGAADTGAYWVVVSNSFSSASSSVVTLTLLQDLLAYEGFNYVAGSSLLSGQTGGLGWDGAWTNATGVGGEVISGNLDAGARAPSGYDSRSAGNSARVAATSRCGRRLDCSPGGGFGLLGYLDANGRIGADGKTLYISFLQQPTAAAEGYEFEFHRGVLGEAGRIAGLGNACNSTTVNLRAPDSTQTPLAWGDTNVNLYVLRIDFKAGNDDVYVYRNPSGYAETDNEPVLTMLTVADMSFDGIAFAASNGVSVAYDELRLGANWGAVLGGPPLFLIQPANLDLCCGQTAAFAALAQSAQPVAYQWYHDSIALAWRTNSALTLSNLGLSDAGKYWLVASNSLGMSTSRVASLTVQAIRLALPAGSFTVGSGGSLVLNASVDATPPIALQWFKDGTALIGQTDSTFTRPNATVFDAGQYVLVASNLYGSVTSAVATVCADLGGLLAYEGFDYPNGDLVGQNGGIGWDGPWENIGGSDAGVVPGSLFAGTNAPATYSAHALGDSTIQPNNSRSGRFLDCSAGGPFAARGLIDAHGNIGAEGQTLYISFLQQPNATTSFYEFEFHRGDLGDSGRIGGIGNDLGSATSVNLRAGGAQTPIGPGSTNVNFFIARIDFKGGRDDVRVFLNPVSAREPATPTLTALGAGDMSFDGISFGAYLNDRAVRHDEVRLGLTWGDVIGDSIAVLRIVAHTNNQSALLLAASPNVTSQLQAAPTATGPWTNLARIVPPITGAGQFIETNAPDPQRFYRTMVKPAVSGADLVIADFEDTSYGHWVATGAAFGSAPVLGTLPNQQTVSGYQGLGLANSYHGGDAATGALTSPPFTVTAHYLNFLIGGGNHPGQTCLNLLVNGVPVLSATGANSDTLARAQWDVSAYFGQTAVLQVVDTATGLWGHILVDQIVLSDRPFLAMTNNASRTFLVANSYLNLPVKTGSTMRQVNLSVGGQTARQFDIELADDPDFWVFLDLTPYLGQFAVVSVNQLPANSGALLAINQADAITGATNLYRESLRPQFHFSSRRGWNNDANGMVWDQGEYHLYYQHNPYGWNWGDMHWGHAVSSDLVQWTELPIGIYPHQYGDWVFSGSAVLDVNNTSGFQSGPEPPIVAAYTSTGRGECIAFSNDRGRTFTDYSGDPVVVNNGRDPHLLWYAPSNYWVMAVYDNNGADGIAFHSSPNLRQWTYRGRINGFFECPDLFPLPVDGQTNDVKWVISDGSSGYMLGQFNGAAFTAETAKLPGNSGSGFYAAQTFTRMPPGDSRRVRIGWAQISMPGMPFNQMMYFPTELTLRTLPAGVRLCFQPVAEITNLYANQYAWTNLVLSPGNNPLSGIRGTLFDLKTQFTPGSARNVSFTFQGVTVVYDCVAQTIACNGLANSLAPGNGVVHLEILVDRDSIEIFGDNGQLYMPMPVSNPASSLLISLTCAGGAATFDSLIISKLKSAWPQP